MANQLGMDKTLAIKHLRHSGLSQQAIADALGGEGHSRQKYLFCRRFSVVTRV